MFRQESRYGADSTERRADLEYESKKQRSKLIQKPGGK
jgi:hypothetical protein